MRISENVIGYLPVAIKKFAVKYADVGRNDLQGCDPHPLYIEHPDKYSVNGRIKVSVVRRLL
jgi:hypothetical protein